MGASRSIRKLGDLGRWDRRARVKRALIQLSLRREWAVDKFQSARDRWGIARSLAAQALVPFALSVGLYALVEGTSLVARRLQISPLAPFVERVSTHAYEAMVGSGVGAIATFLGLYYATVGVVASTVYGSVPASIRTLFVQEPNGVVYVRGVAYALIYGLLVLGAGAVGYGPSPLGLVVFGALTATSVLRLLILGGRIFNFFDPTALSAPLTKRFVSAATMASKIPASLNAASQITAHRRARGVLDLYRQLAMLLEDRTDRDATGPNRLTHQVLRLISWYATVKSRIPSDSTWWDRIPDHPNWLTAGYLEMNAALATATGIRPKLAPDPLWVESAVSDVLRRTLAAAYKARGSVGALGFAQGIANVVNHLAARLQVDEALVLERVWSGALRDITAAQPAETDQLTAHQVSVNQLAAAEQFVMPMIEAWLGYVRAASNISRQNLSAVVATALADRARLYSAPLPATTVRVLEGFAQKLDLEIKSEGRRITPSWWLEHFAARSIAMQLRESHDAILTSVDARVEPIIRHFAELGRHDLVSIATLSALELVHKIEAHQGTVRAAFEGLEGHKNSNTSIEFWPETPDDSGDIVRLRATLNLHLARALPNLRNEKFHRDSPDVYGQTYQFLLEALFVEILEGDDVIASDIFTTLFHEVDYVRARLRADLVDNNLDAQLAYAAEPLAALMELSGYACLMERVNGTGIWTTVQSLWDSSLAADGTGEIAQVHVVALEIAEDHLGFNPGTMARSMRSQRLRQTLSDRGIRGGRRPRGTRNVTPRDPIMAVFVPGDHGGHEVVADLFVAEYLMRHLPSTTRLSVRTRSAIDALGYERERAVPQASAPERHQTDPPTEGPLNA